MSLVDYIVETFGYNEPFFMNDIVNRLRLTDNTSLMNDLNELITYKKIYVYANGIYFVPNPNSQHNDDELNDLIQKRLQRKINCGM